MHACILHIYRAYYACVHICIPCISTTYARVEKSPPSLCEHSPRSSQTESLAKFRTNYEMIWHPEYNKNASRYGPTFQTRETIEYLMQKLPSKKSDLYGDVPHQIHIYLNFCEIQINNWKTKNTYFDRRLEFCHFICKFVHDILLRTISFITLSELASWTNFTYEISQEDLT